MERSGQELVEFLAAVSTLPEDAPIDQHTIEHAAEAIGAEVAALVRRGSVLASVGFPVGRVPTDELVRVAAGETEGLEVPGAGFCSTGRATLGDGRDTWLVVARAGEEGFTQSELMVLRGLAQVHALTSESRERQRLLLRLSRIQRSISHGSDLQDVLDAVVSGAGELLPGDMVGLRLVRPGDNLLHVVASTGLARVAKLRMPVAIGEGAGGRAFAEERLVVMHDYAREGMGTFREHGVVAAMAAPVYDDGQLAGALSVASRIAGRTYSTAEQEMLLAFAEHASLALTDARRIHARHAQVIREAEDRFRALVENSTDVITVVGDDFLIEYQAPSIERALGYKPEALRGRQWLELVHPDERVHVAAEIRAAASTEAAVECRMQAADGTWIYTETLVHDLHEDAAVGGVVLTTRDVSERQRAAEALREQQRYMQGILDNTPAAIYVKSPEGRFLLVNSECERFCGLPREEIIGRLDTEIFPPEIAVESRRQDEEVLLAGAVMQWDEAIERPDGLVHEYFTVKFPLFDATGEPYAICLIASDVTERKTLERNLHQAQRLESVGQLAGGIAHDFNNLLSVIQGHVGFLLEDLPEASPLVEDATAIKGAAQRAAALTQELLVFAGRERVSHEELDLNEIVLDAERLLHRTIGDHITLETSLEARLPAVYASAVQLQQVLVNLVVNARDAMPDGGRVQITTDSVAFDQPPASSSLQPGRHVRLVVSDDGEGMSPETAARALEPFYTTKERGKGSGLGLSTVYGIVTQAGGHLDIVTAPGQGTSVTILLPALAAQGKDLRRADESSAADTVDARGTVLLVEDEPGVRAVAARVLSGAGYRVLTAEEGFGAMSLFDRHERDVDVVLTDIVMPGMSGSDLAAELRGRRPELPVVFMSGYTGSDGPALDDEIALLSKPFESHELLEHVGAALRATGT